MCAGVGVRCSPELAFDPLGQVVPHLDGEVLPVQGLHLVQSISQQLLGLDPHGHRQRPEGEKRHGDVI